jgi:stage II sporulation protein R
MKKLIILFLVFISIIYVYNTISLSENIIPDEAIRFRVIANSNTVYDQNIKIQIRNEVQNKILELTKDSQNINETRDFPLQVKILVDVFRGTVV